MRDYERPSRVGKDVRRDGDRIHHLVQELETYGDGDGRDDAIEDVRRRVSRQTCMDKLRDHKEFVTKLSARLRENDVCSICMEQVGTISVVGDASDVDAIQHGQDGQNETDKTNGATAAVVGCCFNRFCLTCLQEWRQYKEVCPMCRVPLRIEDTHVVVDEHFKLAMRHKIEQRLEHDRKIMNDEIQRQTRYLQDFVDLMNDPSTRQRQQLMTARGSMYRHTRAERSKTVNGNKVADIVDVVRQRWSSDQESPPKVIVFSDNTSIFGALAKELDGLGVSHSELDGGSIRDMDSIISRYKCGDLSVIMVNSSMFDCGMNLENTTDIVFVHKVKNAAKYDQVIGRAQRYGRRNRLNGVAALPPETRSSPTSVTPNSRTIMARGNRPEW